MDRIVDLVRQLEPAIPPPSVDVMVRRRAALLRSMSPADEAPTDPHRWRGRRDGWFIAVAGVAAVVVVAAILVTRGSPSSRPPASTSAVLAAMTTALANTSDDVEEIRSSVPGAPVSTTSWVALTTGACRADTLLNGQRSLSVYVEDGEAVLINYSLGEWWTRGSEGVTCDPLTPQAIEQDVMAGSVTVAGHVTIDGQPSLKLMLMSTTSGLHPQTKLTTLWVDATTYLPIQSVASGHLVERTYFAWLPSTRANSARLGITIPAGFKQVAAPPAPTQSRGASSQ